MGHPEREYGLGKHGEPEGVPYIDQEVPGAEAVCPNCGCKTVYAIRQVMVKVPLLKGSRGLGSYIGCAACPWASPMVIAASAPAAKDGG